jgi:hypothetical protein
MAVKAHPNKRFLVLTYNARLKHETRKRMEGVETVEIHTFHSFGVKYLCSSAYTDESLLLALRRDSSEESLRCPEYDVIVVDEVQDCTLIYQRLVERIPRKKSVTTVALFGDPMQFLYGFKGADSRFLTMAEQVWGSNGLPWGRFTLSQTYRMTPEITAFINHAMLTPGVHQHIKSCKPPGTAQLPGYMIVDSWKPDVLCSNLINLCHRHGPSNIFVLSCSVRKPKNPVKVLVRMLEERTNRSIPMFISDSDDEMVLDERVLDGKLVFTTFHSSKGLERDVVVVLGFDCFQDRNSSGEGCPPPLYVATTRSKGILMLCHHETSKPLSFLNWEMMRATCTLAGEMDPYDSKLKGVEDGNHNIRDVTDVVRFKSPQLMLRLRDMLRVEGPFYPCGDVEKLESPPVWKQASGLYERANDVTGNAVTLAFAKSCTDSKRLLQKSLHDMCTRSGVRHRQHQTIRYDWVGDDFFRETSRRLEVLGLPKETVRFEHPVSMGGCEGRADMVCLEQNRVVEVKCKEPGDDISAYLQVFMYAYMMHREPEPFPRMEVFNVLDGSLYTVDPLPGDRAAIFDLCREPEGFLPPETEFLETLRAPL